MQKKRLTKKIHKYWLELGVVDASQNSNWRKTLFDSEKYTEFDINSEHCEELDKNTIAAIKKYNLKYKVAKVDPSEAERWLSKGGLVIFKFWAADFPSVKTYSGNNPDIV